MIALLVIGITIAIVSRLGGMITVIIILMDTKEATL